MYGIWKLTATVDDRSGELTDAILSTYNIDPPHPSISFGCSRNGQSKIRTLVVSTARFIPEDNVPSAPISVSLLFDRDQDDILFMGAAQNDDAAISTSAETIVKVFQRALFGKVLHIHVGSKNGAVNVSGMANGAEAFLHFCTQILR